MTLRHLDLFSGIGGFALAAQWAGFTTVGFSEIDTFCSKVLHKHWPHIPNYGDVRNIRDMGKLDLITGGFPCQPFSNAGKRKGKEDDRHLWPYFRQIIRNHHPRFVVAENVTGIINMELDAILDDLETCGYDTETLVIPACALGAPHRRERVWIIAYSVRERCDYGFDHPKWQHVQDNWERNITALQTEWYGFIPKSWKTFNFQNWLGLTADPDCEQRDPQPTDTQAFTQRPERSESFGTPGIPNAFADASSEQSESKDREAFPMPPNGAQSGATHGQVTPQSYWQENKPPIPGVDDGLPNGLDRNKALGNAIVPQVAYPILRLLALMGEITHV